MDWLLHNPIADMRGPNFLVFYGLVTGVLLLGCWAFLFQFDPSRGQPAPSLPAEVDPYEVGYLQGGTTEVVRLVVLSLMHRGYLELHAGGLRHAATPPDPRHLSEIEAFVFNYAATTRNLVQMMQLGRLARQLEPWCRTYSERLAAEHLLMPAGKQALPATMVEFACALSIAGLAVYKIWIAISRNHYNVGYLFGLCLAGLFLLAVIHHGCRRWSTQRGRAYVKKLQLALAKFKEHADAISRTSSDTSLMLLAAAFGVSALAGTVYDDFVAAMRPRATADTSGNSSSSSCSSSSCGSSSCGGGGGGCGGGGCGGCGT